MMPASPSFAARALRLSALVAFSALTLGLMGCSKPEQLTGNYTATCNFKGSYRGGGRPDNPWTRQCVLTLEPRNEHEIAMRFDTGDAIECYGHATQTGANGERKMVFANNDLTCRAKTLPAPAGVRVEQCPMPATFEITEVVEKNKKPSVSVKATFDVADKRACVFSYYAKVAVDAKLPPGGKGAVIEVLNEVDAGPVGPLPTPDVPPPFPYVAVEGGAPRPADGGAPHVDASAKDAATK